MEALEELYWELLGAWNRKHAADFAALFAPDGSVVGFDGSQMQGPSAVQSALESIFSDHDPARYVGKIREVRALSPDAGLLRAVAGMIDRGASDLNENLAVQSLIAVRQNGTWRIALWQNTPARFDGRPEARRDLMDELRELLPNSGAS
jgi:uncharacterized protein (TIGR02246 family)